MMTSTPTTSPILRIWRLCQRLPGGRRIFAFILGRKVRYSGTIRARVDDLAPGYARVHMPDRRRLRNHLQSIHAIALANLGELTTGLAMMAAMPAHGRGIPIEINIEFLKKARGEIIAECHCALPAVDEQQEHRVEAQMTDLEGDPVARFGARWIVGPRS